MIALCEQVGPRHDYGAHRVHAGGPGLERGIVNEPCEFNVWTREAGAGQLSLSVEGPGKVRIAVSHTHTFAVILRLPLSLPLSLSLSLFDGRATVEGEQPFNKQA